MLALALLTFILVGLQQLHKAEEIAPYDTSAYIALARDIRNAGGPLALIRDCFNGTWPEANRMPLYPALLSIITPGTIRTLARARLLTLLLGAAGIAVTFLVARRMFGPTAAVLASTALAINTAYISQSTMVACEVLLAACITPAWLFITRLLQGRSTGAHAGLMIGLGYLTKGTALFLPPVAAGVLACRLRKRIFRSRQLWLGAAVFCLVASPLLVRNIRRYRSPFYNENSNFIWTNGPNDLYSPDPNVSKPTFLTYCKTHTLRQTLDRMLAGAFQQGVYTVVAVGQTYLLNEKLAIKVWPIGLLILALAATAAVSKRSRPAVIVAAAIFATFFIFFSWYPARDIRFLFPLLPIILILAGSGAHLALIRLAHLLRGGRRIRPTPILTATCATALLASAAFALADPDLRKNPLQYRNLPPAYQQLLAWLKNHALPGQAIMRGPSHVYDYSWSTDLPGRQIPVPSVASMEELQQFIREKNVRYIVVDYSILHQREKTFAGFMRADGKTIHLQKLPRGWRIVFTNSPEKPAVIVFRVSPGPDSKSP